MDQPSAPWRVFDAPTQTDSPGSAGTPAAVPAAIPRLPAEPRVVAALVGAAILTVLAVVLALGGIGGSVAVEAAADPGADASLTAAGGADASVENEIVVAVAGGVARPGVYRLAARSRVADAIAAAGGFGPRVAAARVDAELNLAAVLHDGERVSVPSRDDPATGASGTGAGGPAPSGGPASSAGSLIDLNHATQAQLESLPGIGAVTAGKIIASREETPFRTVDDLRSRKLVGEKTFQKLRPLVTVG